MRPWLLLAALPGTGLLCGPAAADGLQARLGVNVQVVDLCGANSAMTGSAILMGACLSRVGTVITVERPVTVAFSPGQPGASPRATVVQEMRVGPDGPGYLTVIY